MLKKIFLRSSIAVFILLVGFFNPAHAEQGDIYFTPQTPTVNDGGTITLELFADVGSTPLGAYDFRIDFDSTALATSTAQITNGDEPIFQNPTKNVVGGSIFLNAVNSVSLTEPTGIISLARIEFNCSSETLAEATVTINVTDFADPDFMSIGANPIGATVTVVPSYTVTFEDFDGTQLKTEDVVHGGSATAPIDPIRVGYIFTGWAPAFDNVTSDLTVIAQYEPIKYTVTFKDFDDSVLKTEDVDYGTSATAPADPEREGYTFTGWDLPFDNVTDSLTVTAQYEVITYTVTFLDYDGTTILKEEEVAYGGSATAPADPVREGFTFSGWDVAFDNITSDLNVIAQYTPLYTLTYIAGEGGSITGGDLVQQVEEGADGTTVTAVPDEGYAFVQWDDGVMEAARTDENVTADITVTAEFIAYVAVPSFNPDGGLHLGESVDVTVSCATEGATIRYTTDGTEPTESSLEVVSGGVVSVPLPGLQGVLKAKAWKDGMNPSEVKTAIYERGAPDRIGLYNRGDANFYLKEALEEGPADKSFRFGSRDNSWIPIAGNWDGDPDGIDGVGLYDQAGGKFYLANSFEGGVAEQDLRFGPRGNDWIPIAGDWDGDGLAGVGLYDQAGGKFYLANSLEGGPAAVELRFGPRGNDWIPIAGDWDGNGLDGVGLYDQAGGKFYLANSFEGGVAAEEFRFGPRGNDWIPIAGDWNGDGTDGVGLYNQAAALFFLSDNLESGPAEKTFRFGPNGNDWIAISGKWGLF
jgi:hypothetical protein